MSLHVFVLFSLIGSAYMQFDMSNLDNKELLDKLDLPPELKNKIPDVKVLEEQKNKTTEIFKKKCEQNGGLAAFERAQNAFTEFPTCLQAFVNLTQIEKEIEDAKPNGSVDEVFKKYCLKKSQLIDCVSDMVDASRSCFMEKEQQHLKSIYNISQELVDFACFKDGDRLALFLSEGGVECFQEKRPELQGCFNQTKENVNPDFNSFSLDNLPKLEFDEKQCDQMTEMQACVVDVLEHCQKPTTANIVESLFKFLRDKTPCKAYHTAAQKKGAASELIAKMTTIFMGIMTVLFI